MAVEVADGVNIMPAFLAVALKSAIAAGDFQYEAELYQKRLKSLAIEIPTLPDGSFDAELQKALGDAMSRVEQLQERLVDTGVWSKGVRLT